MTLKRDTYASTGRSRAQALAVIAHAVGRTKELPGFDKRLVLGSAQVKKVRSGFKLTQKGFADLLNVEISTVQNWEQGRRSPDGPVTTLMLLMVRHPKAKEWLLEMRQQTAVDLKTMGAGLASKETVGLKAVKVGRTRPRQRTAAAVYA